LEHPTEPTDAMITGSVFHKLVLEPDTFDDEFAVLPDGIDRRTKEGKAAWADWQAENAGKMAIARPTLVDLQGMANSVHSHIRASSLLSNGVAEQSLFWDINGYSVPIPAKCRIDYAQSRCLIDIKTTVDARPEQFGRSCWNFRYHVQAAFYSDAYKFVTGEDLRFVFIAVEKTPPYAVATYMVNEAMIEQGRREYQRDLEVYAECLSTDIWPAYPDKIQEIVLPIWAQDEESRNGY
jgi:exodeoxyribonuclease VIII